MLKTMGRYRRVVCAMAASTVVAACSSKPADEQTAAGSVDSATLATTAATPAAGPAVHVTRTDGKSVSDATQYAITADNFNRFMAAADSIVALQARDSVARAFLAQDLTDAGSTDADAGLRWLESNAAVSHAITSAGISVKDYFVEAIAIAAAQRFIDKPDAAPPTPTLSTNAELLRTRSADLARLQTLREGKPSIVVKP
jgi:hypothetical protein